jgi:multiple sugar transport system ATP-binding protein
MAQVSLKGIGKRYGAVQAVSDLSLDIHDREFFVLLGPTGAGKSTTLRCIAGLEQPEAGDIEIAGERINDWSAAQRDVALVFQQYSLYPNYTVRENLAFPLKSKLRNFSAAQIAERVDKAARTVRISHLLDRRTDRLSGGEMQRVSIGRAIVREPRVFLMDEPLSNLDAKLRELLRAELKGLQQRLGTTLIFVTHDQVEAMTMGDRIGVVHQGRLVQVGTPYEIYNAPANTFVASFVGAPAINLLDLAIDLANGTAHDDALAFPLDDATRERLAAMPLPPAGVRIGVRPEDVRLLPSGGMAGTLYGAENHGAEIIAIIRAGPHMLRATIPADARVAVNDPVQFCFAQDRLHFFDPQSGRNLRA